MSDATPPRERARWRRYAYVAVGLALYVGVVAYFGWRQLAGELLSVQPLPLFAMLALLIAGFALRAWKWRYALGPGQGAVSAFLLSKFAGAWSPGRIGEAAPLLLKEHRHARMAAWILLDRVIEAGLTLVLGLLGIAVLRLLSPAVAVGVLGAALAMGVAAAWLALHPRWFTGPAPEGAPPWRMRVVHLLQALQTETRALNLRLPGLLALTIVAKLTDLYAVIALCDAFDYPIDLWTTAAARCAHALVAALPITPDATGVPFVAAAWFLNEHGGIPYPTLAVAFGMEVVVINVLLWVCAGLAAAGRISR